MIRKV